MEHKQSKGRTPKRVVRARAAARYPLVRLAPSRHVPRSLMQSTPPPVLSLKYRTKLLYNEGPQITSTGAAANAYVFSANGLFDPNITGTGHQPMGFDQLMLLYEHYTVQNCRITVSFVNESATETGYVGIAIFPDTTPETNVQKLVENGLLKRAYLAANAGNSKSQVTLTSQCKISSVNGRPESIVGDYLFRGDSSANPTEQTYLHVFAYNIASVNSWTVRADVLIEYDATFTEPRKLAQS